MFDPASTLLSPFRQRAPFAGIFIAASLGVLASDKQPEWSIGWLAAFICSAPIVLKVRSTLLVYISTLFVFAFWHGNQMATDPGYQRYRQKPFDGNEHTVTLLINSEPKVDQLRSTQRFIAMVTCIDNRPAHFHVSGECSGEPFAYGDRIISQGKFSVPASPMNPGEFDFGAYLRRKNVYLNFRALHGVPAEVVARNQGNPFVAAALAARRRLAEVLQDGLQDDPEVAQTVQGMILGGRAETSPELKRLFQDTGTIHLFAASGLQLSFFAGLAWIVIRYVQLPRRWVALAIVPVVLAYCAITGFYPATVRATVMAILMAVGVSLERPIAMINSLCASGVLILAHDTQELFQTGFQLSFVAVLAILTTVRPLGHLLFRPFEIDPFLPIQLLRTWQRIWRKMMLRTCEIFSLSIVCWGATLPILILREHHISLIAIFANLLVVPLATVAMSLGVASALLTNISEWIAVCFNNTNWLITKAILLVLHGATSIPCHCVNVSPTGFLQPDRVTVLCEKSEHVFHLHLGGRDWLINTGNVSQWRVITEPYLQSQGVNRLDTLILCDIHRRDAELLDQAKKEFQIEKILSPIGPQDRTELQLFRAELSDAARRDGATCLEIFCSDESSGRKMFARERVLTAILVHLGQFRVLILPDLTEENLSALTCNHVDVVYCAHLRARHFPRQSIVAKLSPSVLVLNGTKAEITANSVDDQTGPMCFYVKQDGAVTTALVGGELVVKGFSGSKLRLQSLSR